MRGFRVKSALVAATALLPSVLADVDPIVIKGSKFFYKTNGTEFFIRGVAYQQDVGGNGTTAANTNFVDPLTDVEGCKRDIPLLTQLRTNTIRVYAIDTTKDHTQCMQMLQDAGIYLIADLSAPNISINRDSPDWSIDLYSRYTNVVDTLQGFNNVLGFFAGNEVSNNVTNVNAIPFVKAAVRDTKTYIKQKGYRAIGVGYAADDDATIRTDLEDYMNCGPAEDSIDFFGYNIYSWCGESDFVTSGYQARTQEFSNYTVPAFFAEYGCNQPEPRLFDETLTLFSKNMTGVWSGGIVYEYFQAANKFGLVEVSGNSVSKLPDFTALSTQIAKVTPSGVQMNAYTPSNTIARDCPATGASWQAVATPLPVTPNEQLCSCMVQNLTCVAKPNLKTNIIGDLFGTACDPINGAHLCDGIAENGTTGTYGAYSACQAVDKLSWAFNAYFLEQMASNSANTDACNFGGNATTQSPSTPSSCGSLLGEAGGVAGTGTVTSQPTGTGAVGGSASSSSSSTGAAQAVSIQRLDLGYFPIAVYVVTAALAGCGMILL